MPNGPENDVSLALQRDLYQCDTNMIFDVRILTQRMHTKVQMNHAMPAIRRGCQSRATTSRLSPSPSPSCDPAPARPTSSSRVATASTRAASAACSRE